MIARAQPKVAEVIGILEPHMNAGKIDSFTLKRLRKEVELNLHIDPFKGHIALCMISFLDWDEQGMAGSHSNVLAIRDIPFAHAHYANLLMLTGRYEEALESWLTAIRREPMNLTYLKHGIQSAKAAVNLQKALELLDLMSERAPGKDDGTKDKTMNFSAVLQTNGIGEDVASQCNAIAFEVLRRNHVRYTRTRISTDRQDNSTMFYIDIDADDEIIGRLDEELGNELFERVPEFHPDKYWVGYEKLRGEE